MIVQQAASRVAIKQWPGLKSAACKVSTTLFTNHQNHNENQNQKQNRNQNITGQFGAPWWRRISADCAVLYCVAVELS